MKFSRGGGSFLSQQLGDDLKEFSLRTAGLVEIDTAINRQMPRGIIVTRLIVVATFFVEPQKLL